MASHRTTRFAFACPLCGGGNADARLKPPGSRPAWNIGCWRCAAHGLSGGEYLRRLAQEVGCVHGGGALLADPLHWLAPIDRQTGSAQRRGRNRLPSGGHIAGWEAALATTQAALRYLRHERGLAPRTLRSAQIGYAQYGAPGSWSDHAAFTLPVFAAGAMVNLRKRFWPTTPADRQGRSQRYVGLAGRGTQLYPAAPSGRCLVLAEGEFDALVTRQHGIEAVTTTGGAGTWKREWSRLFRGRSVAVIYDAGAASMPLAERRAEVLREAGASAWAVDLAQVGLEPGEDLTDWFVTYRRSAGALRKLVARSRPTRRCATRGRSR
jgi:hypothetical protein